MSNIKIIERIEKLLRLSKSDNQHEAELAAQRASELMTKHQISMSSLDVEEMKNETIGQNLYEGETIKRQWVPILADACAKLFDGMVVQKGVSKIFFVGFDEDNKAAQELFRHLYGAWDGIVNRDSKIEKLKRSNTGPQITASGLFNPSGEPFNGASYRNSHGLGYANGIRSRVLELVKERKKEVQAASVAGTDLIIVKGAALRSYEAGQNWRSSRTSTNNRDRAGYSAGSTAGQSAALGGAIA